MKKKLLYILAPALLLASALVLIQPQTIPPEKDQDYHLDEDYGVNFLNGNQPLSAFYTIGDVQTKLKDFYGWAKYKGWSDAEILSTLFMEAAWHDAFWRGTGGNYNALTPANATNITVPTGRYRITTSLEVATGIYTGQGSRFCDTTQYGFSFGSTELVMDHARWKLNRYPDKFIMRSTNWGSDDALGAWCHHTVLQHFNFNGARRQKNLVTGQPTTALVAIWDIGEACDISDNYFTNSEGDGLLLQRSTPAHVTNCSFFTNNGHGAACVGSGNFTFIGPSGDENGLPLISGLPGYGRPGNGTITIVGFKYETGTSPGQFQPFDGQPAFSFDGWWTVAIWGGTMASTAIYPYCFIHERGAVNSPSVKWEGVQFFGNAPKCILYDENSDTEYGFVGDAYTTAMDNGRWHISYGLKSDWPITIPQIKRSTKGVLQHVGPDGAASWATAGIYNPYGPATTPPPPTCKWVPGTPVVGPCINGSQTITTGWDLSPAGCSPAPQKPADVLTQQACGPAFTDSVSANITSSSYSTPARSTWMNITGITLRKLNVPVLPVAPNGVGYIMGSVNSGIAVLPNGSIVDSRSQQVLAPAGTVKANTTVTVTLAKLNSPWTFTFIGAIPGTGIGMKCTVGSIVVSR